MAKPSTNSVAGSMPRPMRTRPVSAAQVRAYANKAEEYAEAAASELKSERDGATVEKELRRLIPLKTKAEYEPDAVAPSIANKAAERAQRCAAIARAVAASTKWGPAKADRCRGT